VRRSGKLSQRSFESSVTCVQYTTLISHHSESLNQFPAPMCVSCPSLMHCELTQFCLQSLKTVKSASACVDRGCRCFVHLACKMCCLLSFDPLLLLFSSFVGCLVELLCVVLFVRTRVGVARGWSVPLAFCHASLVAHRSSSSQLPLY